MKGEPGESVSSSHHVQIFLDGEPIELQVEALGSLSAIKVQLELIALRKERVLSSMEVDGEKIHWPGAWVKKDSFRTVSARTMSYEELSTKTIETAKTDTRRLESSVEEAVLVVMINNWPTIKRIWDAWQPEIRKPLTALNFLRELWGDRQFEDWIERHSLNDLLEEIDLIVSKVNLVMLEADSNQSEAASLAFSEILEHSLVPWLSRIKGLLDALERQIENE